MMKDNELKIIGKQNKIINLNELFMAKEESRKEIAKLSFSEKIKMLVSLQDIAIHWGGMKDVIVWKL